MTYDPKSVDLKIKLNYDKLSQMAFKQNEAIKCKSIETDFFWCVIGDETRYESPKIPSICFMVKESIR